MNHIAALSTILCFVGLGWADCLTSSSATQETPPAPDIVAIRTTGLQYFRQGQYEKALGCYAEALQVSQQKGNPGDIANDLNDIAIISEQVGRYTEARSYYLRQLELLDRMGDSGRVRRGAVYAELAGLSMIQGSFSEAESGYKKAIAILARFAGPNDQRTAKAVSGLARLYAEWGKYEEATALLRKARALAEKSMPEDSPQLISLLDAEASLLCDAGKFSEAEKRWMRALSIANRAYGEDSGLLYTALLLHLGQLYGQIHDYKSAEIVLERALAAERKAVGADEMDRAIIISALADIYSHQNKYAQAEPLFAESEQMLAHCDRLPLACASVRSYLGDYYVVKGQWKAAESQYQSALNMREKTLGEHPLVASSLMSLSRVFRKLKRKKEAKLYAARAEQIMMQPGIASYYSSQTVDVRSFRAGNQ